MRVTLESTSKIVELNGVPARIWEGTSDAGVKVHCFITRIAADPEGNLAQFEQELREQRTPSADIQAYPARLVL